MGNTYDWTLSRIYGTPVPMPSDPQAAGRLGGEGDGYGSQIVNFTTAAQEVNLGRNKVYCLLSTHDGYFAVLDGYDGTDVHVASDPDAESSITDSTGHKLLANTEKYITTTRKRHVLSIKAPDAEDDAQLRELRIQAMVARDGR